MNRFKGIFVNSSFAFKFVFIVGAVLCLSTFAGLITSPFLHFYPGNITILKGVQFVQSVCTFALPPFLFALFCSDRKVVTYLQLDIKSSWAQLVYILMFIICAIPFMNLITELNRDMQLPASLSSVENWMKDMEDKAMAFSEKILAVKTFPGLIANLFLVALVPAFGEELLFRGSIQRLISDRRNKILAIWITAFIFSAVHLQFYGFFTRMLLGAFFGYLVAASGNLRLAIWGHFFQNGIIVVYHYLKNNNIIHVDIDKIGTHDTCYLSIISFVTIAFIFLLLRKQLRMPHSTHP